MRSQHNFQKYKMDRILFYFIWIKLQVPTLSTKLTLSTFHSSKELWRRLCGSTIRPDGRGCQSVQVHTKRQVDNTYKWSLRHSSGFDAADIEYHYNLNRIEQVKEKKLFFQQISILRKM